MRAVSIITPLVALILSNCAYYDTDKNGKPRGLLVGTRAGKLAHNEGGFYAENLDTQTGFKDAMDFGGTAVGGYFGYKTVTETVSSNNNVSNTETNASASVAKSKEVTKRTGIKEAASVEKAKIHATPVP